MDMPHAGDVIAYGGSKHEGWSSRIIEAGEVLETGDDSIAHDSHNAIYMGAGEQVESVFPWTQRDKVDYTRKFQILRWEGITDDQRRAICLAAQKRVGGLTHPSTWYNLVYIFTFGLWKFGGQEVCCLLAGDCYKEAGLNFRYATPDQLRATGRWTVVQTYEPKGE